MRTARLATAVLVSLSMAAAGVTANAQGGETCGQPFQRRPEVVQAARGAQRVCVGRRHPVEHGRRRTGRSQIAVVVGSAYPPFRAEEGRIERQAFESLMKSAYGVTRANGTVSEAAVKTGRGRVVHGRSQIGYRLRVVSVQPSRAGDDALTVKLCK